MSTLSCELTPQRVLLVGATGLIGRAITERLHASARHGRYDVIALTRHSTPGLDLEDHESIAPALRALAPFDHVVVAAGAARFAPLARLDSAAFEVGLRSKLMGQVHLTLAALAQLRTGGSITLTSGALAHTPIPGSAPVALVNGALESFVRAIALDVDDGRRINIVSPGWIEETLVALDMDPSTGVPALEVGELYARALGSDAHGQVFAAGSGASVAAGAAPPLHATRASVDASRWAAS